jgi:hypothetical protein
MKRLVAMILAILVAGPALADCAPPPGLVFQAWYAMCGTTARYYFANGAGRGMPYEAFVANAYQQYASSWAGQMPMRPIGPTPGMPAPGMQQCPLGAYQCFNGWARNCQAVGNGTMWITGSQRC